MSLKPRKKPQFLHLHPIQAAKAKQAWVNKTKLRSQWAKQKRKLQADSSDPHQQQMDVDSGEPGQPVEEVKVAEGQEGDPSRKRKRPSHSGDKAVHHKPAKQPSAPVDGRERRERVRDLSRMAYAPESLHTFKADPLHRQRSHGPNASRGRAPGNTSQFSRGRGQPNMKLRMNALLEKIKLDAGVS